MEVSIAYLTLDELRPASKTEIEVIRRTFSIAPIAGIISLHSKACALFAREPVVVSFAH